MISSPFWLEGSARLAAVTGGEPGPRSSRLEVFLLRGFEAIIDGLTAADRDLARLHRLGDDALQIDTQQAILEVGGRDFDIVGKLEAPFEGAGRNTAVQILPLVLVLAALRSEEHTSELQSLMRISYAVFCLKKKKKQDTQS